MHPREMTKAQRASLWQKYKQSRMKCRYVHSKHLIVEQHYTSFRSMIYLAHKETYGDAVMINWCNMWIGIEPDGYTHS